VDLGRALDQVQAAALPSAAHASFYVFNKGPLQGLFALCTLPLFAKGDDMKKNIGISVLSLLSVASLFLVVTRAGAQQVGEVSTVFKLLSPNDKIVVDAYDDPKVAGVTCYVSRAKTGGYKGALGLAEDKAEASIACRQTGPITFTKPLEAQEDVMSERISLVFKKLRVVRMVDAPRNTLVYLTYSDRLIEGSPQNSVTAVPVDRANKIPVK
jgi:CreA protein